MSTFLDTSSSAKRNTIPYPNLISQILAFNDIWYLMKGDKVVFPKEFSKTHVLYMKISFTKATGPLRPESQKKDKETLDGPSNPGPEEAYSSQAGTASPHPHSAHQPSFTQQATQTLIQNEVAPLKEGLHCLTQLLRGLVKNIEVDMMAFRLNLNSEMADFKTHVDTRLAVLFQHQEEIRSEIQALDQQHLRTQQHIQDLEQQTLKTQLLVQDLNNTFDCLVNNFNRAGPSQSSPPPSDFPPAPTSDLAPSHSTAIVPYVPPSLPDDKGGEEGN